MKEKESNNIGYIKDRSITDEMETSYLDYAMSVIVARALPDVRDGLKPVHRRVLYSMLGLGLFPGGKYRKSATVVGEVLGKYHPHGDVAVYDTLVRMAQNFAMRYPLVNGQGNFGSVDGDTPAAMRYTECKLSKISMEALSDIEKGTVDWAANYDDTRKEPKVLPAKLPNLLINGTVGIAVGMATSIPPHNLSEVIAATVRLIDNPEATNEELLEDIKGPDFPTGGEIYDFDEIKNAYATGRGRINTRAKAEIHEKKDGYYQIIVYQIPYQVNKATLIEKIAELVKDKKILGISGVRDESDRDGIRIVIDLKKDAFAKKILNQLYKHTQMQEIFHMNLVALVDGVQPKLLTLRDVLVEYIKHRQKVVERRTQYELKIARNRVHILDGLLVALASIDKVVETIKRSPDKISAAKSLEKKFKLTSVQVDAILEMKLSSLAALERKRIEDEHKKLKSKIKYLSELLESKKKILSVIKNELIDIKERFGDERKTKVYKTKIGGFSQEDLIPDEEVIVTFTKGNYIKRLPVTTYRAQARGGKGVIGVGMREEDVVDCMLLANTHDDILCFTNRGRVFQTKVYEIPQVSRQSKGQAIVNLLQLQPGETVTGLINLSDRSKSDFLIMATKKGMIKKTGFSEYANIRKTGIIAIGLKSDDELHWVGTSGGENQILMVSRGGQAIRFSESDVRSMGRTAFGIRGIRLLSDDELVGMDILDITKLKSLRAVVVTGKGLGKRTKVTNYPLQRRAGGGVKTSRITNKTGQLIGMQVVEDEGEVIAVSKKGQVIRIPLISVKLLGRSTSGVKIMRLNVGDELAAISVIQNHKEKEQSVAQEPKPQKEKSKIKLKVKTRKLKKPKAKNIKKAKSKKTKTIKKKRRTKKAPSKKKIKKSAKKTSQKSRRVGSRHAGKKR